MPLTTQQQQVLTALHHADGPLSAYALLDRLRSSGFSAPMQVYRVLEKLRDDGLIHRLATLNAWVACAREPGHCTHNARAFAICDQCGRVDECSAPELTQCLGRWANGHAFRTDQATIELHGQCGLCTGQTPDAGLGPSLSN
ncbi:Zinc uptake regulation protein ZUR [Candidatus Burkholderia verschuerenii]|uniref:Zinc uptake regulation protein ZUR n=1 Tax=Candidatus Burkholderia verschuerenii TaxID=242163 RepID=A0A0L0MB86_9BURK|nr:Fur family transcriptional regulator [Candidatus Burkholderia verschuerenii]KND59593.1 Zinc uptake regulation protein ZUR [Candidatus Burkholderia verschuerenii]